MSKALKQTSSLSKIIERFKAESILLNLWPSDDSLNSLIESDTPIRCTVDSRNIENHSIYIAIKGSNRDGHDFIEQALSHGCLGVIAEKFNSKLIETYPNRIFIQVDSSRAAWAYAESTLNSTPEQHLKFFGVTGTNGKTSTAWIAFQILRSIGEKAAYCGTIGMYIGDEYFPSSHTSPDPPQFFEFLKFCVERKCEYVCMECSSHAIDQKRFIPIRFEVLAFTSFSRDHLDYHKSMEEYWKAKCSLFQNYGKFNTRILWSLTLSSKLNEILKFNYSKDLWVYGNSKVINSLETGVQSLYYNIKKATLASSLVEFNLNNVSRFSLNLKVIGDFALDNFSAALLACLYFKPTLLENKESLETVQAPPGRLEIVSQEADDICVLVDYAHTPDALEKALITLKDSLDIPRITVMGCGGDRDKGKRPVMGRIAETYSTKVYITSDNPRTENPDTIIKEIVEGLENPDRAIQIANRSKAIEKSILTAETNSCILIAGKGHENYQEIKGVKYPFDDRKEAEFFLRKRKLQILLNKNAHENILVLGGGVSGESAALYLEKEFAAKVLISDQSASYKPKNPSIDFITGEQTPELINHVKSLCILSPGISFKHPVVQTAVQKNKICISEIDLALSNFEGKVIAITGTNGKSTVCKMVEHILKCDGKKALAAGNIGLAATEAVQAKPDVLVLELSSYQLEQSLIWKADSACFTSFSQDHLARHGTMKNYFAAKWKLFSWLESQAKLFLPWHLKEGLNFYGVNCGNKAIAFVEETDLESFSKELLHQEARHSKINALMAAHACCNAFSDLDFKQALKYLESYIPLAFRFQLVGRTPSHKAIFNDSKSTNVESSLIAVKSMQEKCLLLLGGQSKDEDFSPLLQDPHSSYIQEIYCFGASGKKIYEDLHRVKSTHVQIHLFKTLKDALEELKSKLPNLEVSILFSPGCASFDEFKNFEHRGDFFNQSLFLTPGTQK